MNRTVYHQTTKRKTNECCDETSHI